MYPRTNNILLLVFAFAVVTSCAPTREFTKGDYQKYVSNDRVLNIALTVSGANLSPKDSFKLDLAITNNSTQAIFLETKKPRLTYSAGPLGCNLIFEVGSAVESGLEFPVEIQRLNPSETIMYTKVANYNLLLETEEFVRKTQKKEPSIKSLPIHIEMIYIERFEDIVKFQNLSTLNQTIQDASTFTISSIIFEATVKKKVFDGLSINVSK